MIHRCKKFVCVLLSLVLMLQLVQPALAVWQEESQTAAASPEDVVLTDKDGNQTRPDKSWEEVYPYGAFAFDVNAAGVKEGEDAVVTVYRLGGTKGRATAYLNYNPTVVKNEDGSPYYGYGLSARDITLEVEEPLPAAQYQPLGKDPDPDRGSASIIRKTDSEGYVLSLSREADSYQWQILYEGRWCDVGQANRAELNMDAEFIDGGDLDFRCVYTADGKTLCTDSLNGVRYEKPEAEVLEPMPADLDLTAEPTYTALELADGDDLFAAWVFSLTFAEGEWKKELHIRANTDGLTEALETATLCIAYTEGGAVYAGSDSLIFHVEDIDESVPSTVGFSLKKVDADKADGTVEVLVTREGGSQRPVSVDYRTVDGDARAGEDYVEASGTLMFYGNVTELPVKVELIDDGEKSDEPLDFSIELSGLKGDDNCAMEEDTATVTLTNSGTGDRSNLASVLHDSDAVDLTAAVKDSPTAANAGTEAAVGEQVEMERKAPAIATYLPVDGKDRMTTQAHTFTNDELTAWGKTAVLDFSKSTVNSWNYGNPDGTGSAETFRDSLGNFTTPDSGITTIESHGIKLSGSADTSIQLRSSDKFNLEYAGQMFSKYQVSVISTFSTNTQRPQVTVKAGNTTTTLPADRDISSEPSPVSKSTGKKDLSFNDAFELTLKLANTGEKECSIYLGTGAFYGRRYFKENAFSVDITTPNDANTAPDGCVVISDYKKFYPTVAVVSGDNFSEYVPATSDVSSHYIEHNSLYVGTTLKISAPDLEGYQVANILVFQKKAGSDDWTKFTKFDMDTQTYSSENPDYTGDDPNHTVSMTVRLLGVNSPLNQDDLNAEYKFRVVYERAQKITVDLTPSLPRNESGTILTDQVSQLFADSNGKYYNGTENHGFGSANITYSYTRWHGAYGDSFTDFSNTVDTTNWRPQFSEINNNKWTDTFSDLQYINFGLPKEDMLICNGKAYAGNETIYLTESDLTTDLVFSYYHSSFQGSISPMTTTVLWKQLYWDGDGDGKISGQINETTGQFELAEGSKDVFVQRLIDGQTINENMIAPQKNSEGKVCQYFIQLCYTMTPRCLSVPAGGKTTDKAQVLPAFTSALDPASAAYAALTNQQKMYTYVVSGKDANEKYTSDDHPMYGAAASAKALLSIPLGGDKRPPVEHPGTPATKTTPEVKGYYTWDPDWFQNYLYPYASPEPVTIQQSLAGPTEACGDYTFDAENLQYKWNSTDALGQINGYLASFTGSSTFVLVSQQQSQTTDQILAANRIDGLSTQNADTDPPAPTGVSPDSNTLGLVRTNPDPSSLAQMDGGEQPTGNINSGGGNDGKDSALSEFSFPFKVDFPTNELGVTDYVTILFNGNQIGFSVSIPLGEISNEKQTDSSGKSSWGGKEGKHPGTSNKEAWTKFSDLFTDKGGHGDSSYKAAKDYRDANKNAKDAASGVTSQKVSVAFTINFGFIFEYNPLDNGFYFKEFKAYLAAELNFRAQARLTVFPLVYAFFDVTFSVSLGSGLTVERKGVEMDTKRIDAKTADKAGNAVTLTYYPSPASINYTDAGIVAPSNDFLRQIGMILVGNSLAKRDEYFARKDFFLTSQQWSLLDSGDQSNYKPTDNGQHYINKKYATAAKAQEALTAASTYSFETDKKAFSIRFDGKLYVEVQQKKNGVWTAASKDSGLVTGTISSDGSIDTQVVLKQQDGMDLGETVRVVLHAMEYDENLATETTKISYLVDYKGIYDFVHWNGINLSPELAIEAGVGIGVEVLKAELFIHFNIGASFTFGAYNDKYDPGIPQYTDASKKTKNPNYQDKYLPASVEEFEAAIGIALRVVLVLFTYELDFVTYEISYDGHEWEYGWHFLNDMAGNDADDSDLGVTIRPPQVTAKEQQIYSPEDNNESGLSTQAYNPTDTSVPFQTSGYGQSMDAVNLTTGIPEGSQYKVLRVGDKNYIAYTISRSDITTAPEDSTMVVLSELACNSDGKYGLINPADKTSETKYIPLETDGTGDLDFDIWADADGKTIHAAWVSYATITTTPSPQRPEGEVYEGMTANNYATIEAPNDNTNSAEYKKWEAWKAYYEALSSYNAGVQARAKTAAENTVVKTASWTVGQSGGFSAPVEITSNAAFDYVFLPAAEGSGNSVFFSSTAARDNGKAYSDYQNYIDGKKDSAGQPALPLQVRNYLKATKLSRLNLFGTQSALNLAVKNGETWTNHQVLLNEGETLANAEFTAASGGGFYVAYTTERTEYTGGDMLTVYRLYLRHVDADGSWDEKAYLLRELWDYDRDTGTDGVYSGGSCVTNHDSPYLSSLRFLTANLDRGKLTGGESALTLQDAVSQTVLLFEMNGSSYIIPAEDLGTITGGSGGTIYPFFVPATHTNDDGSVVTDEASGKLQVDINADTKGNLYAVYVGSAPGTAGNALYRAAYDAQTNTWGDGVMLAMHDMDVYEASLRNDWDQAALELAYLYRSSESSIKDEAALTALYGEDALNTIKNVYTAEAEEAGREQFSTGDGKTFTFSELQTTAGSNNDLLVVTQGFLQEMTIESFQDKDKGGNLVDKYVLAPKYTNGAMDSTLGTYAISFGQGDQQLGNGSITFNQMDFSAGSELYVTVTADNVGDTAFRGSPNQPITATLNVLRSGSTDKLAEWTIKDNVISGQSVEFVGYCTPLNADLANGDKFTLTLKENTAYAAASGGTAAEKTIDLFTVEEKPDLSVDGLSLKPTVLSTDGTATTMEVSFVAANHGSADAKDVYAQFSYVSGYDSSGQPQYVPLDLSGEKSNLTLGTVSNLSELLSTQAVTSDLPKGKLALADLETGMGQSVSGPITVPYAAYAAGESRYADVRVELFSGADVTQSLDAGVVTASHNEYYTANNLSTQAVEAYTTITAPHAIVIPLGTTTKVPVSAVSSRGQQPALAVQELSDDKDGLNNGILNFKKSAGNDGSASGVLSLTPMTAGTGTLHLTDTDTNSSFSIAFEVTDNADGIDIFNDNEAFTFSSGTGDWLFKGFETWGPTTAPTAPLRQNLSVGRKNATFTFDSVAEAIDLYFEGQVKVELLGSNGTATVVGTYPATGTNPGGEAKVNIPLGTNPDNLTRTVKITVLSDQARFDRLVESYTGGTVPTPDYDGVSPYFIWSRSFPDTGSVKPGTPVPLKVYALDNSSIASLTVTPSTDGLAPVPTAGNLWCYDFGSTVTKNGTYTITATDDSGNQTTTTLLMDWFLETPTGDQSSVSVPLYASDFYQGNTALSGSESLGSADGLNIRFAPESGNPKETGNTHEVYYFDGSSFQPISGSGNGFPITANGLYWTRTVNEDGTWSAQVLNMTQLDSSVPQATLTYNDTAAALEWTAGKSSTTGSAIKTVSINGFQVNSAEGTNLSGSLPIRWSGEYSLVASDASDPANSTTVTCNVVIPLQGEEITVGNSWSQHGNNGTVTVDIRDMFGGKCTAFTVTNEGLVGSGDSYQYTLISGKTYDPADTDIQWFTDATKTWENLEAGDYTVVIRDANDPSHCAVRTITVEDTALKTSVTALNSETADSKNGKFVVTTDGGETGLTEFAIIPVSDIPAGTTVQDYIKTNAVTWTLGDENGNYEQGGLAKGEYYVAARSVYASPEKLVELAIAEAAWKATELAAKADPGNTEKEASCQAAKQAYETILQTVSQASANYYQNPSNAAFWDGVALSDKPETIHSNDEPADSGAAGTSGGSTVSNLRDIGVDRNGSVVFTLASGKDLTASDQEKIRNANASDDTVIKGDGLTAMIPEDTLTTPDFDLNRLLADSVEAKDGMVVEYTDLEGNTRIDAFGIVTDGDADYIVLTEGDYRIVPADAAFSDIAGLWGEDDILFAANRGLVNGTGDGKFSPNITMSRAMFVTVLWRMTGGPKPEAETAFTDLTADWNKDAVAWAVEQSIVTGYNDTTFGPNDPVTREQMCVLMMRYLDCLGWALDKTNPAANFADADQISTWAADAVKDCTQIGLINGVGENRAAPKKNANRMEASAILTRFVKAIVEQYCG